MNQSTMAGMMTSVEPGIQYQPKMVYQNQPVDLWSTPVQPQPSNQMASNTVQFNNVLDKGVQIRPIPINNNTNNTQVVEEYMQRNAINEQQQQIKPVESIKIVRRNLTIAELILLFVLSTVSLGVIQQVWNIMPKPIVSIEWRN